MYADGNYLLIYSITYFLQALRGAYIGPDTGIDFARYGLFIDGPSEQRGQWKFAPCLAPEEFGPVYANTTIGIFLPGLIEQYAAFQPEIALCMLGWIGHQHKMSQCRWRTW